MNLVQDLWKNKTEVKTQKMLSRSSESPRGLTAVVELTRAYESQAVSEFMKDNGNEVQLARRRVAIDPEVPIRRTGEERVNVRRTRRQVTASSSIGKSARKESVWNGRTREVLKHGMRTGRAQRVFGEGFEDRIDPNRDGGADGRGPNVNRALQRRLRAGWKPAVCDVDRRVVRAAVMFGKRNIGRMVFVDDPQAGVAR